MTIDAAIALGERYLAEIVEQRFNKKIHVPKEIKWGFAVVVFMIAQGVAYHDLQGELEHINGLNSQLLQINSGDKIRQAALEQEVNHLRDLLMAKDRPIVVQAAPDLEVQKLLKRQDEELIKLKDALPSPKRKALQLSNDILKFLADRMKIQPSSPDLIGATREQWQQKMNEHTQNYVKWMNETAAEYQVRFGVRVSSVMEDMQTAGLNTANVQMCIFSNGNTFMTQECGARIGALAEKLPR